MGRPKNVHSRQRGTRETGVSAFKINLQRNNFRFKKIFRHVKLSSPFSMRYKSYKMRAEERRRNEQTQRNAKGGCQKILTMNKKEPRRRSRRMEKTILAARRLTKKTKYKNTKTQKGLTVRQLSKETERECMLERERGRWEAAHQKSLFSGQVRKASATPTPETGYVWDALCASLGRCFPTQAQGN